MMHWELLLKVSHLQYARNNGSCLHPEYFLHLPDSVLSLTLLSLISDFYYYYYELATNLHDSLGLDSSILGWILFRFGPVKNRNPKST